MKYLTLIFILILATKINGQVNEIREYELIGCWTDSREENLTNSEVTIFRPCNYKVFPASRFRFKMILDENSKCFWLDFAPNDAHSMKEGKWYFDSKMNILRIYGLDRILVKEFRVKTVNDDILIILN